MMKALLLLGLAASLPLIASAEHRGDGHDRVSFGDDITVDEGGGVGDIVCAFCTVRLHGDASGDVVAFFGKVYVDPNRTIDGDLVAFGGEVALGKDASVGGSAVVFGSRMEEADSASIRGDRVMLPGMGWLLLAALAPLLILTGIVWLVVWMVRRQQYRGPMLRRS